MSGYTSLSDASTHEEDDEASRHSERRDDTQGDAAGANNGTAAPSATFMLRLCIVGFLVNCQPSEPYL